MPTTNNQYVTPSWVNGSAPAITAAELTAMGRGVEAGSRLYGVCSTPAATAAKTVSVSYSGTLGLYAGLAVKVKFVYGNTAANPTLNVNGTGAVPVYAAGSAAGSGAWSAGSVVTLTYDGTNWNMQGGGQGDSGPTQVPVTLTYGGWSGTAAPYTQTVSVAGVTPVTVGRFNLDQGATATERAQARSAMLYVTAQGSGTLTVTADGTKPTLNLPCVVTIESERG